MMKLGANSVLFGGYDMATAFRCIRMAGYDGIELSAIDGMSEHLFHVGKSAPQPSRP
jgi:sugar phosphate isomerase/epimerase